MQTVVPSALPVDREYNIQIYKCMYLVYTNTRRRRRAAAAAAPSRAHVEHRTARPRDDPAERTSWRRKAYARHTLQRTYVTMPTRVQVHSLLLQVRVLCVPGARGIRRVARFNTLPVGAEVALEPDRPAAVRPSPAGSTRLVHAPAFATHLIRLVPAGPSEPIRCTGHPWRGQPERPAVPGAAEVRASSLRGTPSSVKSHCAQPSRHSGQ
jgi:hypothetical protein